MAQEIECKLLGMKVDEFIHLGKAKQMDFKTDWIIDVQDAYWYIPSMGSDIRFRTEELLNPDLSEYDDPIRMDLTIKGLEENDGDRISERRELILPLAGCKDVPSFLGKLGGLPGQKVSKERTIITNSDGVRIHHDALTVDSTDMEWVEIEADTQKELHDFLFKLGVSNDDELKKLVSNKTTV